MGGAPEEKHPHQEIHTDEGDATDHPLPTKAPDIHGSRLLAVLQGPALPPKAVLLLMVARPSCWQPRRMMRASQDTWAGPGHAGSGEGASAWVFSCPLPALPGPLHLWLCPSSPSSMPCPPHCVTPPCLSPLPPSPAFPPLWRLWLPPSPPSEPSSWVTVRPRPTGQAAPPILHHPVLFLDSQQLFPCPARSPCPGYKGQGRQQLQSPLTLSSVLPVLNVPTHTANTSIPWTFHSLSPLAQITGSSTQTLICKHGLEATSASIFWAKPHPQ